MINTRSFFLSKKVLTSLLSTGIKFPQNLFTLLAPDNPLDNQLEKQCKEQRLKNSYNLN